MLPTKKSGKILLHEPLFVLLKKLLYVSTLFSLHNITMKMHIFSLVMKIYFHRDGISTASRCKIANINACQNITFLLNLMYDRI